MLAASASIPAVFPPQFIDVSAGPTQFQEMHVDGSVVTPVFTLPQTLLLRDGKLRTTGKGQIYVIINGRLEPEFEVTQDNTLAIVGRSFTTASRAGRGPALAATYRWLARTTSVQPDYVEESGPKPLPPRASTRLHARAVSGRVGEGPDGRFWNTPFPRRAGGQGDGRGSLAVG